jgi:UDP-N-acetylmuramate dehydrogenase
MLTRAGTSSRRSKSELRFGYRDSSLDELVVLEATFELEPRDSAALTKHMQQVWILKRASQPAGDQGAGCIFKNPGGATAASLIEEAKMAGARSGDAEISQRNANFIVVGPRAKARDVLALIEIVRQAVAEKTGFELEPAIEIW